MAQEHFITADFGRTSTHLAVYRRESGTNLAPVKVEDHSLKTEAFVSSRDGLLTERADEAVGILKGYLLALPEEVKATTMAITIDSHGAGGIVLDERRNPLFTHVYDHDVSSIRDKFFKLCGSKEGLYLETSTPELPLGINWLWQIAFLLENFRKEMNKAKHVTSLEGYALSRLTGHISTDVTHLANHGYAANVHTMSLSSAVFHLTAHYDFDVPALIGDFRRQPYIPVCEIGENPFGLRKDCKMIGIAHDTSLIPEVARIGGFANIDSSGTWSCLVALARASPEIRKYMEQWSFTMNASIYGEQSPTAMFRGGQMWESYMKRIEKKPDFDPEFNAMLYEQLLRGSDFILPAYMNGVGPYKHRADAVPEVSPELLQDPAKFAHAVHIALALQTLYSNAAANTALPEDASIKDILEKRLGGERLLVVGPASKGLSIEVMARLNPGETYVLKDSTPVNLAGALVGMAAVKGVRPDKLDIDRSSLPIEKIVGDKIVPIEQMLPYASAWEAAARRAV